LYFQQIIQSILLIAFIFCVQLMVTSVPGVSGVIAVDSVVLVHRREHETALIQLQRMAEGIVLEIIAKHSSVTLLHVPVSLFLGRVAHDVLFYFVRDNQAA
jgi:hypothetical protein